MATTCPVPVHSVKSEGGKGSTEEEYLGDIFRQQKKFQKSVCWLHWKSKFSSVRPCIKESSHKYSQTKSGNWETQELHKATPMSTTKIMAKS